MTPDPIVQKIWDLQCQGRARRDIAKAVGCSKSKVAQTILRGRALGYLPEPTYKTPLDKRRNYYGIRRGNIKEVVDETTWEAQEYLLEQVINGGYASVAEYLRDLYLDEYYNQMEQKK